MDRRIFLQSAALASLAQAQPPAPSMKTSVMLWTLRGAFEKKLEIAAAAGLQSVELVDEHVNWTDADVEEKKRLARSLKLGIDTLIATPRWGGRPVSMVVPGHREAFLADVAKAVTAARKLEIPYVILMAGNAVAGKSYEEQWASLVESAKRAGDLAAQAQVTLVVEPLNAKVDHKGFFLTTCVEGLKLIQEVANPHVKLLFDIYHEQVQTGNVIRTLRAAAPYTAIFHVADNPGRNDPGTGEMNYAKIYAAIRDAGYGGYVTFEYLPRGDAAASLTTSLKQLREAWAA